MLRQPINSPWLPRVIVCALAAGTLFLSSCEDGRNFSILGYTTAPQYDLTIHTVYVPIFKNRTLWRGLEFELTKAVVREIEAKTPYKVVSDPADADTELTGAIISLNKNMLNRNQLNEVREAETTLAAEVTWRNRRTGEVLSRPRPPGPLLSVPSLPNASATPQGPPVVAPGYVPPDGTPLPPPPTPPTLVQSVGDFIPEVGQSITSARQQNVNRLAIQIVSMMEKPW